MNIHRSDPLKLVLDTNVALDWILFEDPAFASIRDAIVLGSVSVCSDSNALLELRDVMSRKQFGLSEPRQRELIDQYCANTVVIPRDGDRKGALPADFPTCRDHDDDPFLALAYRCGAALLVSRDKEVLVLHSRCAAFGFGVVTISQAIAEIARHGAQRSGATEPSA